MTKQNKNQISILAELDRLGYGYTAANEDEVKLRCPAHDDSRASMSMNIETGLCKCHSATCGFKGDFVSFFALATKTNRTTALKELSDRYNFAADQTVDNRVVLDRVARIWEQPHMLKELRKRGIEREEISKYKIGFDSGRIQIPVYNDFGVCVNIRKYLPGANGADKMKNMAGRGKLRLYLPEQVEKYDNVIIAGGELKAIVCAERLNQHGYGACAATGGEGNWESHLSDRFKDKNVFICFDIDEGGRKAADIVAAQLSAHAKSIRIIKLPLDADRYPTGDVNDYVGPQALGGVGASTDDLRAVVEQAEEWTPPFVEGAERLEGEDKPAIETNVNDATEAKLAGKKISLVGVVAAVDSTPYLVPHVVRAVCDKSQKQCVACPVFAMKPHPDTGYIELTINRESPAVVAMVNAPDNEQNKVIQEACRIPNCKVVEFKPVKQLNVEDTRIVPQLEMTARNTEERLLPALCATHGIEGNTTYRFTGRVYAHPKTQKATLLVSEAEPAVDALTTFDPPISELAELDVYQPEAWTLEEIEKKLDSIYADFEANVTKIYERRDLHACVDLAYHSPLFIPFDNKSVKGWVEVLILGDSAQGKTETTLNLQSHYGLGEKVESKNASVAGLLGGVQPMAGRWFVTWGKIPLNDKRLVVLEELKGASRETISKLTDMRSSGVAEIDKIEKRRTHARTRLVALSNPRSEKSIASYTYGIEAISELIGSPEDIRRFDMAMVVASGQINAEVINQLNEQKPVVDHVYTSELSRRLLLWTWTRDVDKKQVVIDSDVEDFILKNATALSAEYSDIVPLVDRGSMRLKLARLSAAIAARTFSCDEERQVLIVRQCHVEYVLKLLRRTYEDRWFGYRDFSKAYFATRNLKDADAVKDAIQKTPFPNDFIESMLHATKVEPRDIQDWCGWERGEASELVSLLVRKRALIREGRSYTKNPDFIALLKSIEGKLQERPDHIGEI